MPALAMPMLPFDEEESQRAVQQRYDDMETRSFDTLSVLVMAILMVLTSAVVCVLVLVLFVAFWK